MTKETLTFPLDRDRFNRLYERENKKNKQSKEDFFMVVVELGLRVLEDKKK